MIRMTGIRKNGNKVNRLYECMKVAKFEFEITQTVAEKLELFYDDKLIDSYEHKPQEVVTYTIIGESPYNKIHKNIEDREDIALVEFNKEKSRCDWLTLYKECNNEKVLIMYFVKGE